VPDELEEPDVARRGSQFGTEPHGILIGTRKVDDGEIRQSGHHGTSETGIRG
jgi:hypothetical protein